MHDFLRVSQKRLPNELAGARQGRQILDTRCGGRIKIVEKLMEIDDLFLVFIGRTHTHTWGQQFGAQIQHKFAKTVEAK